MTDIKTVIALLPVVFMFHDFEEIVMFKPWLTKNKEELQRRFPTFEHFLARRHYLQMSTSAFAVAVLHEFLLISIITFISLWYNIYFLWFAAFMAYFLHLFVHIAQWCIYRKYVPVIITSFLTLPYCLYTFGLFVRTTDMTGRQMILWTITGVVFTILSFIPAFGLASIFEKWKNKIYSREKP